MLPSAHATSSGMVCRYEYMCSMDGWMDIQMDGWMDGYIDGWIYIDRWIYRWMDEQTDTSADRQLD